MKKLVIGSGLIVVVYIVSFLIYYNSNNIARFNRPAANGEFTSYALVNDHPRINLIKVIAFWPGLKLASFLDGTLYIQGGSLKVRKYYWENFALLFSRQEFY